MIIGGKEVSKIIITTAEGEVLAVVMDSKIVEKDGVSVIVDWELA